MIPSDKPLGFSDLLELGTALCAEWEDLSTQQFAALATGNSASLSVIHAHQARLADEFYHLEQRWEAAIQSLPPSDIPGTAIESAVPVPHLQANAGVSFTASLRTKRHEFVAAVQSVFAANRRNLKALSVLISLNTACEPLTRKDNPQTYSHTGALKSGGHTLAARLDCQG